MTHDVVVDGQRYIPAVADSDPMITLQLHMMIFYCGMNREELLDELTRLGIRIPLMKRITMPAGALVLQLVAFRTGTPLPRASADLALQLRGVSG